METINNRYRIVELIAERGMGKVYIVEDEEEGAERALKTLIRERESSQEKFREEFKLLSELRHPNLEKVFDYGKVQTGPDDVVDQFFFTSEYIDGREWDDVVDRSDEDHFLGQVVQVCRALQFIHARNLIHYDVKPENVLVTEKSSEDESDVKLIDFGLAEEQQSSGGISIRGTIPYIAPELIRGEPVDGRADLYSLGISIYEILTGDLPFKGQSSTRILRSHLNRSIPRMESLEEELPEPFDEIVPLLVQKQPEDRPASANEVIQRINKLQEVSFRTETKETIKGYVSSPAFVNREVEMETLQDLWKQTSVGDESPSLCVLSGPTGVGKSRLLKEFRIWGQTNSIPVITGKVEKDTTVSFGLFRDLLPRYIRQVDVWNQMEERTDDRNLIKEYGRSLKQIVPEIHKRTDKEELEDLEDEEREMVRLLDEVSDYICEGAGEGGAILMLEDLQWVDQQSLQLIRFLTRKLTYATEAGPLLLVGTRRTDVGNQELEKQLEEMKDENQCRELTIGEFSPEMVKKFIRGMFGRAGKDISEEILELEQSKNPHFLSELLRACVEKDIIVREDDEWHLDKTAWEEMEVPDRVGSLIDQRLSTLDDRVHNWLNNLAIWGEAITDHSMNLVFPADKRPEERQLKRLEQRNLVEMHPHGAHTEYRFAHDRIKTVLLDEMGKEEKTERSAQLLEALETAVREREVAQLEHVERLARLSREAGNVKKFRLYAEEAGKNAEDRYAYDVALRFYRDLLDTDLPEVKRLDILERVAHCLSKQGNLEKSLDTYREIKKKAEASSALGIRVVRNIMTLNRQLTLYDEALEEASRLKEQVVSPKEMEMDTLKEYIRLLLTEANILDNVREVDKARNLLVGAEEYVEKLPDEERKEYSVWVKLALAKIYRRKNETKEIIDLLEPVFSWAEEQNYPELAQKCAKRLGIAYADLGEMGKAEDCLEKSLELSRRIGDRSKQAYAWNSLGVVNRYKGDFEKAIQMYQDAYSAYRKMGDRHGVVTVLNNLTIISRRVGNLKKAEEYLEEGFPMAKRFGMEDLLFSFSITRSRLLEQKGEISEALEQINEAEKYIDSEEDWRRWNTIWVNSALFQIRKGNDEAAADHFEKYKRKKALSNNKKDYVSYLFTKSELHIHREEYDMAEELCLEAARISKQESIYEYLAISKLTHARLAGLKGNHETALQLFREGLEVAREHHVHSVLPRALIGVTRSLCLKGAEEGPSPSYADYRDEAHTHLEEARDVMEDRENVPLKYNLAFASALFELVFGNREEGRSQLAEFMEDMKEKEHKYYYELFLRERSFVEDRLEDWWEEGEIDSNRIDVPNVDISNLSGEKITRLLEVLTEFSTELEPENLLPRIMDTAIQITGASRGFLAVLSPEEESESEEGNVNLEDRLKIEVARHRKKGSIQTPEEAMSRNVMMQAIEEERPLRIENVREEDKLQEARSVQNLQLQSIIAAPLRVKGEPVGAIYLDRPETSELFQEKDLVALSILAGHAAVAIENARLHEEAIRDRLTGLVSHGYFQNRIEEELEKASRFEYPLSLMFIDVDGLKWVNDRFGHAAGDRLIRKTGQFLRKTMRGYDVAARTGETTVGRYGGDEFEVLLPETDRKDALSVAERIITDLKEKKVDLGDRKMEITLSIGISGFPPDGNDISGLIEKADHAMQSAKKEDGSSAEIYKGRETDQILDRVKEGFLNSAIDVEYLSRKNRLVMGTLRKVIQSGLQLGELLDVVLDTLSEATHAQRGVVLLKNPKNGELIPEAFYHSAGETSGENGAGEETRSAEELVEEMSMSVARKVLETGNGVLTDNASEDPGLHEHSTIERLNLKSLMVIPIETEDEPIGIMYLDNPAVKRRFGEEDLGLATALAREISGPVKNALEHREKESELERLQKKYQKLKSRFQDRLNLEQMAGESDVFQEARNTIKNLIPTESNVLVLGESGTGRTLAARVLHFQGPRGEQPVQEVDCQSLGAELQVQKIREANEDNEDGDRSEAVTTIILRNVENMAEEAQEVLLDRIQSEPDLRVLATAHDNLPEEVSTGQFPEELYEEISGATITMPPLDARKTDIPDLAGRFIEELHEDHGMGPDHVPKEKLREWMSKDWSGNVSELRHAVEDYFFSQL